MIILYWSMMLVASLITLWAFHQNRTRGPEDTETSSLTFFSAIVPVPLMLLVGLVILLMNTGLSPVAPLATLALAFSTLSISLYKINKLDQYENVWGVLAFGILPLWLISWTVVCFVRMIA